jgi:ribosomal protein L16 Arg81 hydroxylase
MQEKKNPLILNAEQMSFILNISEQTIKKLAKNSEIPCTFVNRRPQFNWNVLVKRFHELEGGAA